MASRNLAYPKGPPQSSGGEFRTPATSKDHSKSILYSVAPPGGSQHLSLLALDVKEHDNATVRAILAQYGWFQTVISDLPHFTYLGVEEQELSSLGLKVVALEGKYFWVPEIDSSQIALRK